MHSAMLFGAVMAMGAIAAPLEERAVKVVDVVDTVTVTVVAGQSHPYPTAPAAANGGNQFLQYPHHPAPAPKPQPVPVPVPAAKPSNTPSSGPTSGSGNGPTSDGTAIIDVVNKWRGKYGLGKMNWDNSMDSNVQKVGEDGHGVNEIHQLISNKAMGQVITPGQQTSVPSNQHGYCPFEVAYIAWLCEVPSDEQLQPAANNGVDVCGMVQDVLHMEYSDTGHHDILVSESYNGISCGFTANPSAGPQATYQGLWVCDLSSM